jgi:hypothetical protein
MHSFDYSQTYWDYSRYFPQKSPCGEAPHFDFHFYSVPVSTVLTSWADGLSRSRTDRNRAR